MSIPYLHELNNKFRVIGDQNVTREIRRGTETIRSTVPRIAGNNKYRWKPQI